MAMEMPNPSKEGEFVSTSQMEGAHNFTHPINNIKGPSKFTNNNIQTFQHVSLPKGLNSTQKQYLDKKWGNFLL
jgi:hypothetical protein